MCAGGSGLFELSGGPRTLLGVPRALRSCRQRLAGPGAGGLQAYGSIARVILGPREDPVLAQRVRHLTQTRAETIDAIAVEIRLPLLMGNPLFPSENVP